MWLYLIGTDKKANSATGSYLRQAYGVGQELQAKLGVNPFKYGSRGRHRLPLRHYVHRTEQLSRARTATRTTIPKTVITATTSVSGEPPTAIGSGGLTGVWAEENTRESIFAALQAQGDIRYLGHAYQGSHVRRLELSQGHDQAGRLGERRLRWRCAHGGRLSRSGRSTAPTFVVHAIKDPDSGNLDRIQIIKISTKNGKSQEKIYDVVWSGDRKARSENRQGSGRRQYG